MKGGVENNEGGVNYVVIWGSKRKFKKIGPPPKNNLLLTKFDET